MLGDKHVPQMQVIVTQHSFGISQYFPEFSHDGPIPVCGLYAFPALLHFLRTILFLPLKDLPKGVLLFLELKS